MGFTFGAGDGARLGLLDGVVFGVVFVCLLVACACLRLDDSSVSAVKILFELSMSVSISLRVGLQIELPPLLRELYELVRYLSLDLELLSPECFVDGVSW